MAARKRIRLPLCVSCAVAASLLLLGCQSSPKPTAREPSVELESMREPRVEEEFDGLRAWTHLRVIERIGPRQSGTTGAARARSYLSSQLSSLDLEIREQRSEIEASQGGEPISLVHVTAVLPGSSEDIFLLAAHYDTARFDSFPYLGTNESGSGAALMLELARALASRQDRPYTIWLSWIDGDAHGQVESAPSPTLVGSRALARAMQEEGALERIRFAAFFGAVADAQLRIRRDLLSHRAFREVFWSVADDLGYGSVFAEEPIFPGLESARSSFAAADLWTGVMIGDDHYGSGEGRGSYWYTQEDRLEHCSPQSLEIVGQVSLEAISRIEDRLSRIDAFARFPVTAGTASSKIAP